MDSAPVVLLVVLALVASLAGCGGESAEDKRDRAGREWCEGLQDRGLLFEPMSRCLDEYERATREPDAGQP